ncbi:hypothetical protein GGX14DRAFT_566440 [Mycena pura]|uniref:Uncharacterized protein n=1 Tax=Mycena pura TaxID=153505 RepID=A0AAD6VDW2_9AGAR|nr:hypothetical protein GGX14DRAFT_566440 [Mycena pura]
MTCDMLPLHNGPLCVEIVAGAASANITTHQSGSHLLGTVGVPLLAYPGLKIISSFSRAARVLVALVLLFPAIPIAISYCTNLPTYTTAFRDSSGTALLALTNLRVVYRISPEKNLALVGTNAVSTLLPRILQRIYMYSQTNRGWSVPSQQAAYRRRRS